MVVLIPVEVLNGYCTCKYGIKGLLHILMRCERVIIHVNEELKSYLLHYSIVIYNVRLHAKWLSYILIRY